MESKGPAVHHGGTVRAALPRTKPPGLRTHGHPRSASTQNLLFLLAGSAALGLGLAIVKHVVAAAGGTVEARSGDGRGLEVRCTFPARPW